MGINRDRYGYESSPPRADRFAGMFAPAVVDLFAGAGGWSIGAEQAFAEAGMRDRYVDLMVNHWDVAVGVHQANHPMTEHLRASVFDVDPLSVLPGRRIAYLHASPDCTHFSKARGSRPKKKEIRGLAWVVVDWAAKRRPDVITLENVEEFRTWGPLARDGQPCPKRRGKTFERWLRALRGIGYVVEHRELRACDYGAPTTRKRLFVIARCDGKAIVWPEKTHGDTRQLGGVENGRRTRPQGETCDRVSRREGTTAHHPNREQLGARARIAGGEGLQGTERRWTLTPFRTAAECIDWSIPMLSIFATPEEAKAWARQHGCGTPRRPLKPKTLARIAAGLVKYVLQAKRPFIVDIENAGWNQNGTRGVDVPLNTVTAQPKGGKHAVVDVAVAPYTVPNLGERDGQAPRCGSVEQPMPTVTAKGNGARLVAATLQTLNHGGPEHRAQSPAEPLHTITGANDARALVAALVTKHYGGVVGHAADQPVDTVTAKDHNALTVAHLMKFRGSSVGSGADEPCPTITGGGGTARDTGAAHALGVSAVFLSQMYGTNRGTNGDPRDPIAAVTGTGNHATAVSAQLAPFTVGAGGAAYSAKPRGADEPLGTVMVNDRRALVAAFLSTYYGNSKAGHPITDPSPTIVSKDRIQLVTVIIDGTTYVITDIAMRMLQPHELKRAQGFPDDYVIDRTADGKPVSKADQVKLIGNSVPPQFARAIVRENVVNAGVLDEAAQAVPA